MPTIFSIYYIPELYIQYIPAFVFGSRLWVRNNVHKWYCTIMTVRFILVLVVSWSITFVPINALIWVPLHLYMQMKYLYKTTYMRHEQKLYPYTFLYFSFKQIHREYLHQRKTVNPQNNESNSSKISEYCLGGVGKKYNRRPIFYESQFSLAEFGSKQTYSSLSFSD